MHVAMAMGVGMKSCTCRGRRPFFFSHSASSTMSSSVEPGCPLMKYGMSYWSLPASLLAHARVHAREAPALRFDLRALARELVHVGGGAAEVGDGAAEIALAAQRADLTQHALRRAVLNHAPLVLGDRAERAAAEAPAHE